MHISTILALAPFLGTAIAVPSQRQAHEKFHHKKRDITWFTVTSEVVETVYETTTVWVNPGQAPPSPSPIAAPSSPSSPIVASPTSTSAAATSSGLVGIQQPSPSSTPVAAPSPPAPSPSPPAQSPSPPAASPSTPAAAPASPSAAPAPASSPAASPSSGSGSSSGGGSYPVSTLEGASDPDGPCTPDNKCQGEMTFYQVGSGACGGNSDPSELVVAIPEQIMGSQSNGDGTANPLCSRSVMVQLFDSIPPVKAAVVDKCGGCNTPYSLDMSTGLFDALGGDQNVGRYYNMTWYWA